MWYIAKVVVVILSFMVASVASAQSVNLAGLNSNQICFNPTQVYLDNEIQPESGSLIDVEIERLNLLYNTGFSKPSNSCVVTVTITFNVYESFSGIASYLTTLKVQIPKITTSEIYNEVDDPELLFDPLAFYFVTIWERVEYGAFELTSESRGFLRRQAVAKFEQFLLEYRRSR